MLIIRLLNRWLLSLFNLEERKTRSFKMGRKARQKNNAFSILFSALGIDSFGNEALVTQLIVTTGGRIPKNREPPALAEGVVTKTCFLCKNRLKFG